MPDKKSLYQILGVHYNVSEEGIKKAYNQLAKTKHPDKGGNPQEFDEVRRAFIVLSDPKLRKEYDMFGEEALREIPLEEIFAKKFGKTRTIDRDEDDTTMKRLNSAIKSSDNTSMILKEGTGQFDLGFAAWLRNRQPNELQTVNAEVLYEKYGIEVTGYEPIPLPQLKVHVVRYEAHGTPKEVLKMSLEPLPKELHWKEVLVQMLAIPINPADLFNIEGYNDQSVQKELPFIAGSEGVGVILKLGPEVENLTVQDWVIPLKPGLGTWRTMGVFREKDLLKISPELMSEEYASIVRMLCVAFRLLEDFETLEAGDCIVQSGANSSVGQAIIQMAKVLRISTVNLIRERENFEKTKKWLKSLGADVVIGTSESIQKALTTANLPKPRLAIDCIGGQVAVNMANTLRESSTLVIFGATSRKPVSLPAPTFIFKDIRLRGFRFNRWVEEHPDKFLPMIETISTLIKSGKCKISMESYELGTDFYQALESSLREGRNTKIILKVKDNIGETY